MKSNKELKEALERLLEIAEGKLQYATDKNKEWDIEHYKNDISLIKEQLSEIK